MRIIPNSFPIEALESRIAPAVVTVTFTGGVLTLSDDGAGADVSITEVDDTIILTGGGTTVFHRDGVVVDSANLVLPGPIKTLTADFGAGNDVLNLQNLNIGGDVTINGGDGTNTVNLGELAVKGSLKVTGGTGDDTVQLGNGVPFAVKKDVTLTLGDGANKFDLASSEVLIGGQLSYTGGIGSDALTGTFVPTFSVGKDVSVTTGAGPAIVGLAALNFSIGKKLTVDSSGSLAGDTVSVGLTTLFGKIGGDVQITDGAGDLTYNQIILGKKSPGKLNIVTGAGTSQLNVGSLDLGFIAAGPLGKITIDASASTGTTGLIAFAKGGLDYLGGDGGDQLILLGTAGGSLLADLGQGDNSAQAITLGGSAKSIEIVGGDGNDSIGAFVAFGKVGSIDIDTGSGTDTASVGVIGGAVGGAITVTSDAAAVDSASTLSLFFLNATVGSIDFLSEATTNGVNFGGALAGIPIPIPGLGGASGLTVKKAITVQTGDGDDTVEMNGLMNVKVGKSVDLELGDGANEVNGQFANFATKAFAVTGGTGNDTVNLTGVRSSLGATTLNLGAGDNTASLAGQTGRLNLASLNYVSTSDAAETDSLTLASVLVSGKADAKFGVGDSTVTADGSIFGGTLALDTGAGADTVKLGVDVKTTVAKIATILLGEGDDTLSLGGSGVSSGLTTKAGFSADGGTGSNTLTNDGDNVFATAPVFTNFPA